MIWSVIYNTYLAIWGANLKKEAVVAWEDDFGEDFKAATKATTDVQDMIAATPDFDSTTDGNYC